MKFILISFLFILKLNIAHAVENLAFIDLNYIINNSLSGKSINNFINDLKNKKIENFKIIETKIKKDENDLISKKNIIEKSIYDEKVNQIKIRISNYNNERQEFKKYLDERKVLYTNQLLESLNPIISNYVEQNSISIVLPKKMIIIGKKNLDITIPIIKILDKTVQKINFDE
tara:strand:+ start:288 stop:806 length:519 start_codon:yes stop_codon:yes gene_type:complete